MESKSFMELSIISAAFAVLLALFGTLIGLILSFGISGLFNFIIGTLFGRKVLRFKYLIFAYVKGSPFHISNFSPVCEIVMTKENETKARENAYAIIYISLHYITCILFSFFGFCIIKNRIFPIHIRFFAIGVCLWFFFDIFLRTFAIIQSIFGRNDFLKTQCHRIISELMSDKPFGEIDVIDPRNISQPLHKGYLPLYQHLFFNNRLWHDDDEGMKYIVESMEKELQINYGITEKAYLQQNTDAYYDIMFYYCCIAHDPWRAGKIYEIIAPDLLNDKDSNGYRVLAYYTYYILKDSEKAMEYLNEGLKLLDSFTVISQRELEKKLIEELQSEICRKDPLFYRVLAYFTYYTLKDSKIAMKYLNEGIKLLDNSPLISHSHREVEKKLMEELQSEINRNN